MNVRISVIIPLYNKEKFIEETLHSVLNQTFTDFEIVIVNDGSTDGSVNIINLFNDDRIRVITIGNGGVSNARNIGIINAKFEWIALLDADDTWGISYLQHSVDLINNNTEAQVIATNYFNDYKTRKITALNLKTGYIDSYFKNPCINSSNSIIKKSLFIKVGYFNTSLKYGEDQHLWFRLAANCLIYFNSLPLVNYRMADHQLSNSSFEDRDLNSDLVSVIDELEIHTGDWQLFKNNYLFKYLRPYYICDNHLEQVRKILDRMSPKSKCNMLFVFYILPRFLVKPLYKAFYTLKYT